MFSGEVINSNDDDNEKKNGGYNRFNGGNNWTTWISIKMFRHFVNFAQKFELSNSQQFNLSTKQALNHRVRGHCTEMNTSDRMRNSKITQSTKHNHAPSISKTSATLTLQNHFKIHCPFRTAHRAVVNH